jgi:hypothetical protein
MRTQATLLIIAAAGMVLLCCCHANAQPFPCKRLTLEDLKCVKHVPEELLVQFKPGSNEQKIAKALAKGKAQKLERIRVDADGELLSNASCSSMCPRSPCMAQSRSLAPWPQPPRSLQQAQLDSSTK